MARDLNLHVETLRLWVRQAERDDGSRQDGLTSTECEELRHLRRENRILQEEREILQKNRSLLRDGAGSEPQVIFGFVSQEKAHLIFVWRSPARGCVEDVHGCTSGLKL